MVIIKQPIYKCAKCDAYKSTQSFCKNKQTKSGRNCWCKKCVIEYGKKYKILNKEKVSIKNKINWNNIKINIYNLLGNKCNCCGEKEINFLQIDHINNDGFKERHINKHIVQYFEHIKNNRSNFQLLCANCNWGKKMNNGICPHKDNK